MSVVLFLLYATFFNVLCLSRAFPQQTYDGAFLFDQEYNFQDFTSPAKVTAKVPATIRAGKPRAPIIPNFTQQNVVTPVPILKQINRHNENGSYTYGFESADGSFKIETKLATGEVIGKYGYIDDRGKLRVVEYGANKYGFQPAGEGITIPPITTNNENDAEKFEGASQNIASNSNYASPKSEVIRILSKPPNPKRKSPQKPIPLAKTHQPSLSPHPHYSVQEPDESSARFGVSDNRPMIAPSDVNALQFIIAGDPSELREYANFPSQLSRKPTPARFEEHFARDNDRPPFVASFPIPAIFDVIPLPSSDLPRSRSHPIPFDIPSRATAASSKNTVGKNRAKSKQNPQLVLVSAAEEVQNPVRRSSNGVRTVHEGRSILDELMKQYALPSKSPAISDYSFSYNTRK